MAEKLCKAITLYWSGTGNTEKVAKTIHNTLVEKNIDATIMKMNPDLEVDYFDYNLVFIGAPVYENLPPKPIIRFLSNRKKKMGNVVTSAPERLGHFATIFCTYGGGHTGVNEAIPALRYMGQFFEHVGIRVVTEWAVPGFFKQIKDQSYNTDGRFGDVTLRPDEKDLNEIKGRVTGLLQQLKYKL
jgi:flavodoxin